MHSTPLTELVSGWRKKKQIFPNQLPTGYWETEINDGIMTLQTQSAQSASPHTALGSVILTNRS